LASGPYASLNKSLLARVSVFAPSLVSSLLIARLVLVHFGATQYATYTLALALIAIYPLNDVGVGAPIISSMAADGEVSESVNRQALTAARLFGASTVALCGAVFLVAMFGVWHDVVGNIGMGSFIGLSFCGVFYALSFVPSLSQSLLLGGHKNHVSMILQGVQSLLSLFAVISILLLKGRGDLVPAIPGFTLLIVNLIGVWLSGRLLRFNWGSLMARLARPKRFPGLSIRTYSLPMLIITTVLPLAWQSDRLVLSHILNTQAVVNYSITFQIFTPIIALAVAAAQPLWPVYAAQRAGKGSAPNVAKLVGIFTLSAAVVGSILVICTPYLAALISGNRAHVGLELPLCAMFMTVAVAAHYPLGVYLTDRKGLRYQAICCTVALPINVSLSIWLSKTVGPAGPLLGTAIAFSLCQLIPYFVYLRAESQPSR
jgi:O-antigen/teichoic acid export membrane protein